MATIDKYTLPDDLYYDRDSHLWLREDGARVTIGLDALGLESMGDMAYISFHESDKVVARGEQIGSMEASKMVAPILAPIGGRVVKTNGAVADNPRMVNTSPYDKGWLVEMEPSDWDADATFLVGGARQIRAFLEAEVERYQAQGWIA